MMREGPVHEFSLVHNEWMDFLYIGYHDKVLSDVAASNTEPRSCVTEASLLNVCTLL